MSLLARLTLRKACRLVHEVEHAGFDTHGNERRPLTTQAWNERAIVGNFPKLLSYHNITHHLMKTADEKWRAHTSPHAEIG